MILFYNLEIPSTIGMEGHTFMGSITENAVQDQASKAQI